VNQYRVLILILILIVIEIEIETSTRATHRVCDNNILSVETDVPSRQSLVQVTVKQEKQGLSRDLYETFPAGAPGQPFTEAWCIVTYHEKRI